MMITTEAELREIITPPDPSSRSVLKERKRLAPVDRQWLAASPFVLIATSDAEGTLDVSPKGDPPGFVHVIDDTTIAIPDRPGNHRADTFLNILRNPHVGVLFLVPGRGDTLRINGRAHLVSDAPYFDEMVVKGHRPHLAAVIEIEQVFYHCAKAFMRSGIWKHETWQPDALPSTAAITKLVMETPETLEELEDYYGPSYAERLYKAV
ncbi:MAG TPA: pyridoxamine 5'-phosphate oxidase family protein [Candidatus Limnocylindrales bacterium]|nr:pyridoxamine 5'-phosphate oxidase family protein [Candidatus Limnocylindrales bacterium]